jgi:hypothetical protein
MPGRCPIGMDNIRIYTVPMVDWLIISNKPINEVGQWQILGADMVQLYQ